MALTETEQVLWVVESNGTPRSGKGTITNGLAGAYAGSAKDETGADYRAVTYGLLADGYIDPEMPEDKIGEVLASIDMPAIAEYAASRYEIDDDELHTQLIDDVVGNVSPHDVVRHAVKKGFARRVERKVEESETRLLFVDGRNLTPVIESVRGAELLLRIFVDCQPFVAAHREAVRDKIDVDGPDYGEWYIKKVESIRERQRKDEVRPDDPVVVEEAAIDYWFNNDLMHETGLRLATDFRIPFDRAARMLATGRGEDYRQGGRYGAGAKAAEENRQVYYDTSEIGRDAMLSNAQRMVDEALDQRAGRYQALYDNLIRPSI